MSALARYFHQRGVKVCGYDRSESPLTRALVAEGMQVFYDDDPMRIPDDIDLAVYTAAIKADNHCFANLSAGNIPMMKRAAVLGLITRDKPTIAIGGTHGKTTTGCMLSHIMMQAGIPFEALLGGTPVNYHSNYIAAASSGWMVVEADEYDRSFLHLHPDIALITSADSDHLDIYGTAAEMEASFSAFANNIKTDGMLLIRKDVSHKVAYAGERLTYHTDMEADYMLASCHVSRDGFMAAFRGRLVMEETLIGLPGRHNTENALAAAALAQMAGAATDDIRKGLSTFAGVKRRFETCFRSEDMVYIDDYAHHPAELSACIRAARELFPGKKITGVFQPHLYSRTKDLYTGFAESLSALDELFLLEIYPAREEAIEGITAQWLLEGVGLRQKKLVSKEALMERLERLQTDVLITMGAGDIDRLVEPIVQLLKNRKR